MALATNSTPGEIQLAGDLAGNNNGAAPELTSTGVVPGEYVVATLTIDAKGRVTNAVGTTTEDLAALLPPATTTTPGVVQIGTNIDVSAGVISIADASTSVKGVAQIGDNINVTSGVISIPNATTSTKGVIQVGTGLNVTSGVLSADFSGLPDATTSTKGVVRIGTNIDVSSGVISVADGSAATKGVLQVGTNLQVSAGVVSVQDATTAVKGVVRVGTNIDVSGGTISVADATDLVKGVAQAGTGIVATAGVFDLDGAYVASQIPDATTSSKGVVQVGDNINVSSGTISVPLASGSTTFGVVKTDGTPDFSLVGGVLSLGAVIARTDVANTWTAPQHMTLITLTDGATINVDGTLGNVFKVTITANRTLAAPTGLQPGKYVIIITQSGGPFTMTFNAAYKFRTGAANTLSTTANATDVLTGIYDGSNLYCSLARGY